MSLTVGHLLPMLSSMPGRTSVRQSFAQKIPPRVLALFLMWTWFRLLPYEWCVVVWTLLNECLRRLVLRPRCVPLIDMNEMFTWILSRLFLAALQSNYMFILLFVSLWLQRAQSPQPLVLPLYLVLMLHPGGRPP